jgi:L-alanine-DL-glutamate epimerase-like enolase superfamily enzyme
VRIRRLTVHGQWQPFTSGTYRCSGGRSAEGFDSTIVRVDTDDGVSGWGEVAPLGAFYDPAFAAGARAGIAEVAGVLLGHDPRRHRERQRLLDRHLAGHPYAKSPLDMACHDVAARAAGITLGDALGGALAERVALYRSIAQDAPEVMATHATRLVAEGYRRIQVKVGLDPDDDVERLHRVREVLPPGTVVYCDANASWTSGDAIRFLWATRDLDYVLEQPCADHESNRRVRAVCDRPMVLDESIADVDALLRAHRDGIVDGITIKIARVGGITRAVALRDLAVDLGLRVTVEDTGGAEIDTAAIVHLALGVPPDLATHTVDFHHWVTVSNARTDIVCADGAMSAPTGVGLGVDVDDELLATFGPPVAIFGD